MKKLLVLLFTFFTVIAQAATLTKFTIDETPKFLRAVASGSSAGRGAILLNLAEYAESNLSSAQNPSAIARAAGNVVLLSLVEPIMTSGDSGFYLNEVIPTYTQSLKEVFAMSDYYSLGEVQASPLTFQVALRVIQSSLVVIGEFLSPEEKTEVQGLIALVGKAMVSPTAQSVQTVLKELDQQKNVLQKISKFPKVSFAGLTLEMSSAWLTSKVQK
jgi:hypothetical protein